MLFIRPPDLAYRRQALISAVVVAVLGTAALLWCLHYLQGLESVAQENPQLALRKMARLFRWVVILGMIDLSCFGLFLLWLAHRTGASGCWPPPEMPVLRETVVKVGARARRVRLALMLLGNLLLAATQFGGYTLLHLINKALQ